MILNFKEIPQANQGGGQQDTFELFARDFFKHLGYSIIEDPDRGADGKRDLIVEETIEGLSSSYTYRWLVSCKHFAHSGAAVKDSDEINIRERLEEHHCDGFIGFYSTICAVGLSGVLTALRDANKKPNAVAFDHEKIEAYLLRNREGIRLASRYFPVSVKNYTVENPVPADLFRDQKPLYCECCGEDLMQSGKHGLYCLLKQELGDIDGFPQRSKDVKTMYFACKGDCDDKLRERYREQGLFDAGWDDIDDLCIPTIWIQKFFAFFNGVYENQDLSPEAYKKMKQLFIRTFPYVSRHLTSEEKNRVRSLLQFGLLD